MSSPIFPGGDLPSGERDRVRPEVEAHGGAADLGGGGPRLQTSDTGQSTAKT